MLPLTLRANQTYFKYVDGLVIYTSVNLSIYKYIFLYPLIYKYIYLLFIN